MFHTPDHSAWFWAFMAIVTVMSGARLTRLLAFDHYPPAEWLRAQWDATTDSSSWNLLLHCAYCLAPWTGLGVLLWGYFTDWNLAWWLVNGWLAAAYAQAIVVAYDGDD